MNRSVLLWILAAFITLVSAVYQRVTGPTYPVSGEVRFAGQMIPFRFNRSHPGPSNALVDIKTGDQSITGVLFWKRHNTDDPWIQVPMRFSDGSLMAELPHQPVSGKLMYRVELQRGEERVSLPGPGPIVIRFRGDVPMLVFVLHLAAMFGALLFSARAGLEYFSKEPKLKRLTYWTLGFLFAGGFIFGPLMQYYSFNTWWTGWPLGTDLTDNKTAFAFIAWIVAAFALTRVKNPRRWVLGAAVIMLLVYLIPHSVLGSEFDYREAENQGNKTETTR
jgi:hypothetical protein